MFIKSCLLFVFAMLTACTTMSTGSISETPNRQISKKPLSIQNKERRWISGPLDGKFIIIGVSGRLQKPNDEIEAAKLDAARKAAMYYGIQGTIELTNTTGSGGFFDYSVNSKIDLQYDTNYDQYIENLDYNPKDVFRGDGAVYVRFIYNISTDINYSPEKYSGPPPWINNRNLPQFEGYETAVGFAGKRSRLRDTIYASCESVIARLIETASFQVSTKDISVTGGSSKTSTEIRSEGRLNDFQVLEIYIEPGNGSVHTLAAARVSK